MNVSKLRELRGQIGNTFTGQLIDALLEDDDVYPPESPDSSPRVDRSLRGLVLVEQQTGNKWVGWADEDGVRPDSERGPSFADEWPWAELEADGASVRKLTLEDIGFRVRRWDEWTQGERDSYRYDTEVHLSYTGMRVDKAIDIATRGTHE